MEELNQNLANIKADVNLFGEKEEKLNIKDRIGFVPLSIWEPDWTIVKRLKAVVGDKGQSRELEGFKGGYQDHASIFNPHLAQMILSAYCPQNARIIDPFAGGGTRGFIAAAMGHDYFGVELRQEEVNRINEKMKELGRTFSLVCGDSVVYPFLGNAYDFAYTCPPYYNLEVYSELPTDLSAMKTYDEFLALYKAIIGKVFFALKTNSLFVIVVGNFRDKKGRLVHFSGDTIRVAKEVGFVLHDELIFWGASKVAAQRAGMFEANRKAVRVHEYIIVLRKE